MPLLLGVLASLFIGISDTCGRASSRRADSISHVATQMLVGVAVTWPLVIALGSEPIARDLWSGAGSGVAVACGLAIVYHAMAAASSSVVAPIAAVIAALVPLVWDLLTGASLTPLGAIGCLLAVASLALSSMTGDLGDRLRSGVVLAVAGGSMFGLAVVLVADTSEASGAWPANIQRLTGFISMIVLARVRNVPLFLPAGVRRFGIAGGIAGGLGMVAWAVGAQQGDLGTVSVVSSTYPAVVVVLATLFDDDTIRWWQALGIVGAIAGTALIAIGG